MRRRPIVWYLVHRIFPWSAILLGVTAVPVGITTLIMLTQTQTYANALTPKQAGNDAMKALLVFDPQAGTDDLYQSTLKSTFLGRAAWKVVYLDPSNKKFCLYVWNSGSQNNGYHDQESKGRC